MRVLENNNYIPVTCSHCNSSLGVHAEDIRYNEIAHHCSTYEATCGACGRTVGISSSAIPATWIRKIVGDEPYG